MKLFESLTKTVKNLESRAIDVGSLFKHAALAAAYDDMIDIAANSLRNHPEVERAPELYYFLLQHFKKYYKLHIQPSKNDIFNEEIIGTVQTLREWQEHGYQTLRNDANYKKRLAGWKRLYTVGLKGNSFESVISKRNKGFPVEAKLPYWIVFNYGSFTGGRDGYPSYPGARFVEKGRAQIPSRIEQAKKAFDTLYANQLRDERVLPPEFPLVVATVFGHGNHIDIYKVARSL